MPNPGDLLASKLRIIRRLGAGGMGVVYEAMHVHLRRRVAIKVIHPDQSQSPEARTRFMNEARAQAQLPLEHIVQVIDVDTLPDGSLYTVMEYLDGRDLKRELKKRKTLPIAEAVAYVIQACQGVAAAHAAGIVHRDLKPQNIFVMNLDGVRKVKLLDFGIAKFLAEGGQNLTATSEVVGTPTHLAPEQIAGTGHVDGRADIWALGIVLFELVTGQTPFRRDSAMATLAAVANQEPGMLAAHRVDVPPALELVVKRCLEKSPEARFQTALELAAALEPFATFEGTVRPSLRIARGSSVPPPGEALSTAVPVLAAAPARLPSLPAPTTVADKGGVPVPPLLNTLASPKGAPRRVKLLLVAATAVALGLGLSLVLARTRDRSARVLQEGVKTESAAPPTRQPPPAQPPPALPAPVAVMLKPERVVPAPAPARREGPSLRTAPSSVSAAKTANPPSVPGDSVPLHL